MSEKNKAESGSESRVAEIDPTGVALALDGASRERADSFLMKQEALIAAQLHHLHEQLQQTGLPALWANQLIGLISMAAEMSGHAGLPLFCGSADSFQGLQRPASE